MYTARNPEQQSEIFTVPGNICYDNNLMVGPVTNIQHTSEALYLNVDETNNTCTKKCKKWYSKYTTLGPTIDFMLIFIIMGFTVLVEYGYVPHVKLGFFCADPTISYQFNGDTITMGVLAVITFLGPMSIIYLVESNRHDSGADLQKMWLWYRGYLLSLILFLVLCQALKVTTGEHRPHFLHTCSPDAADTCSPGDYITEFQCLNTGGFKGYIIPDSSLSFPSGHAGVATITGSFCAVYIHVRFKMIHEGLLTKPSLSIFMFAWSFAVGISRVQDHRHHWWDVLAGTVLGMLFAAYSIVFQCNLFNVTARETNQRQGLCASSKDCTSSRHLSTTVLVPRCEG